MHWGFDHYSLLARLTFVFVCYILENATNLCQKVCRNLWLVEGLDGYTVKDCEMRLNHLLYLDDIKLYGSSQSEMESLVHIVQLYSEDNYLYVIWSS